MDYISPITTTPFDFKANSSIIPKWEELVIFNERYNYLTQEHPNILLMFELLDSSNKSSEGGTDRKPSYTLQDSNVNWQRIAWAFLKVNPSLELSCFYILVKNLILRRRLSVRIRV